MTIEVVAVFRIRPVPAMVAAESVLPSLTPAEVPRAGAVTAGVVTDADDQSSTMSESSG
jgi:hypothetical protein